MQNKISLATVRNKDPNALQFVIADRGLYYATKRLIDFTVALCLLILLSPIMLIIAVAIYVYSPGPIFFAQERVGAKKLRFGGKFYWKRTDFKCYKFRTMKIDSDSSVHKEYVQALINNDHGKMSEIQGEETTVGKLVHDERIIRPGVLLRKFSLDELPQLWNVIRGDMSLVGPRPAIPYEVEIYKRWHLRRLEAQPGITGLQQITARCIPDFDEQVKIDIEYIKNQSFWLDIKIALKTPIAVLLTRGAY